MIRITDTTDRKIFNSLDRWIQHANPKQWKAGKVWYSEAQEYCKGLAKEFNIDPYKVAGVLQRDKCALVWIGGGLRQVLHLQRQQIESVRDTSGQGFTIGEVTEDARLRNERWLAFT